MSKKMEHAIMRALKAGPGSVPELADRLNYAGWGRASMYPTIRSMVERGLVTERQEPGGPARGGRPRFIYSLAHKESTT